MGKHRRFKSWNHPQLQIVMAVIADIQSVMKCMTSRCAAWFIKDDMVWKPINKRGNLRRIPFKAEHSTPNVPRLPHRAYIAGIVARIVEFQHGVR